MSTQPAGHAWNEQAPRVPLAKILGLFVLSRLTIWLIGMGSLFVVAKGPHYTPPVSLLDCFFRWDATWHLNVAENGYHDASASGASNAVFLPLYAWLLRVVSLGVIDSQDYRLSRLECLSFWRLRVVVAGSDSRDE